MLTVTDYNVSIALDNEGGYSRLLRITNNGFENDWVVLTPNPVDNQSDFVLAFSQVGTPATVVNCKTGGEVDIRVGNTSILKLQNGAVTVRLGAIPETDPHAEGQWWRIGTALQVSLG